MDSHLGKNLVLNIVYNILAIIVPFLTAPYLGRILGAEQIGIYTYCYTIASYFVMFGLLGVNTYGTRTIAKIRESKEKRSIYFWEIYFMQLFTAIASICIYLIYSLIFSNNNKILMLIMLLYVLSAMFDVSWYCQGTEKFTQIVIRNTIIKAIILLSTFIFIKDGNDLIKYFILMALSYLVGPLALWPTILKDVNFIFPNLENIRKHLKANCVLFIPAISASVYQIMDKIMIGAISSKEQLAYYEYADKIINIPNVIFGAIGAVMLSRMSFVVNNNQNKVKAMIGYSMDLSFIIASGFIFGVMGISDELVSIYYGKSFLPTSIILAYLSIVVLFYGWNNTLRMQYIIPQNLDMIYIKATFIGAVINFTINSILIPRFESVGATIGTVIAQISICIVYGRYIKNELPLKKYIYNNIPILISGGVMFAIIKFVRHFHEISLRGLVGDIIIGIFIYFTMCICLLRNKEDHLITVLIKKNFDEMMGDRINEK